MLLSKSNKNYEINGFFMNSIEFLVANFLNELKVNWEYEKRIDIGNNTYFPDFYLIDYNSVIECYGDFWHANPMMMESTDKTHKYITAADVWRRDEIKNNNLLNVVNNVLILWESDIKNNKEQCITNIKSIANDKKLC
jgi:G:T-mismatch repair DNA endonuclease (very short patch repair protein)